LLRLCLELEHRVEPTAYAAKSVGAVFRSCRQDSLGLEPEREWELSLADVIPSLFVVVERYFERAREEVRSYVVENVERRAGRRG